MLAKILKLIKDKILIQILIAIIICLFTYKSLPMHIVEIVYGCSLALKSILIFVLPFLIITAIGTAFARIPKGGFGFALFILGAICISNFINLMISYCFGSIIMGMHNAPFVIKGIENPVQSAFSFHLPVLLENKYALVVGLALGIACSLLQLKKVEKIINKGNKIIMFFMTKIFIRFLPIFIAGSLLKLLVEGELFELLRTQLVNSASMIELLLVYLFIWFLSKPCTSRFI